MKNKLLGALRGWISAAFTSLLLLRVERSKAIKLNRNDSLIACMKKMKKRKKRNQKPDYYHVHLPCLYLYGILLCVAYSVQIRNHIKSNNIKFKLVFFSDGDQHDSNFKYACVLLSIIVLCMYSIFNASSDLQITLYGFSDGFACVAKSVAFVERVLRIHSHTFRCYTSNLIVRRGLVLFNQREQITISIERHVFQYMNSTNRCPAYALADQNVKEASQYTTILRFPHCYTNNTYFSQLYLCILVKKHRKDCNRRESKDSLILCSIIHAIIL